MEATETTAIVKVNPTDYGLTEEKAQDITKNLSVILNERDVLSKQYAEVILLDIENKETATAAHTLRRLIQNNRTKGILIWHKTNKEFFLRGGQFIDAINRKEIAESERMEVALEGIEKYRENLEKERIVNLQKERVAEVLKYEVDGTVMPLGTMTMDVWNNYFAGVRLSYEARKEVERKAEEERVAKEKAEAEARENLRIENIRLTAENKEKERVLEVEGAKNKAIQDKAEKAKAVSDKAIAEVKAKADKLAADLKVITDAEAKIKADAAKEEKRLAKAPDRQKLIQLADQVNGIWLPELKSDEAKKILSDIKDVLREFSKSIRAKAENL